MPPEHETYFLKEMHRSLLLSEGALKIRESDESSGYGIRVLHDGRVGFSYCTGEGEIQDTVEKAKQVSKYSPETGFSFAEKKPYERVRCSDKKVSELEAAGLKEIINEIKAEIEKHNAKPRIHAACGDSSVSIKNNSLECGYGKTGFSIFAEAMIDDGYGYAQYSSPFLPRDFSQFGKRAAEMAVAMKGAKPEKSGKYTVVFSPEALDSMLEVFLPSFSGNWKRKKISKLGESVGKKLFSDKLTIYDDALAGAAAIAPFDGEGTPSKRIALVEKGVVKNFIYDREIAALAREKKDGNCSREDYSIMPGLGNSNIVVDVGDYASFEEEINDFLLVESLHGTHTSNTTSGDFGVEVNVAFRVAKGKKEPRKGFIISGNIFELFNSIVAVEKKQNVSGALICPRIAFDGVSITS